MRPTRREILSAGLLFGILAAMVVLLVLGTIPPGGAPALQ
jgi:hypothetical protein